MRVVISVDTSIQGADASRVRARLRFVSVSRSAENARLGSVDTVSVR